jgi:glycerol-3-phosphate dehydrogenase (NAD(P)+)
LKRLAIIGGGAWGTALATVAVRAGRGVTLWARDPEVVTAINNRHENPPFLPGISLDHAIGATTQMAEAIVGADATLLVVPAQYMRGVLEDLAPLLPPATPLLLCAKGIETKSLMTMSEVAAEIAPKSPVAVLSGPSFAAEVARGLPTAVTIASRDATVGSAFMAALGTERFRPYLSLDPIGAEIGGAVKNVLAIACGIVEGRGLGDNARAALITRGLAEMVRLGQTKSAEAETFRGLSGLGDLVLTCTAGQSRNYALGVALGRGVSLTEALAVRQRSVIEGVATAGAVARLADQLKVEMPIAAAVAGVLYCGAPIDAMIEGLMSRPWGRE